MRPAGPKSRPPAKPEGPDHEDTVDQAHGAVPHALAGIVEDSAGLCAATAAPAAQRGRARSAAPARMGCTWLGSPQLASGAPDQCGGHGGRARCDRDVFTDAAVICRSER